MSFLAMYDLWRYPRRLRRTSVLTRDTPPLPKEIIWSIPRDNWETVRSDKNRRIRLVCLLPYRKSQTGFWLVPKFVTLNGVMTADARYLCGSWASCCTKLSRILTEMPDMHDRVVKAATLAVFIDGPCSWVVFAGRKHGYSVFGRFRSAIAKVQGGLDWIQTITASNYNWY